MEAGPLCSVDVQEWNWSGVTCGYLVVHLSPRGSQNLLQGECVGHSHLPERTGQPHRCARHVGGAQHYIMSVTQGKR